LVADRELARGRDVDVVMTFVSPVLTHHEDPRDDLDTASYSLVKSRHSQTGTTDPRHALGTQAVVQCTRAHFAPTEPGASIDRRGRCVSGLPAAVDRKQLREPHRRICSAERSISTS
jgi:hypothetical protein